jgi:hypothetical protein
MKSHALAQQLIELGNWMLTRPEFETLNKEHSLYLGNYRGEKEKFISAARSLGSLEKIYDGSEVEIRTTGAPLELWARVQRNTVCVKVQEEKWECEPLMSDSEIAQIGAD